MNLDFSTALVFILTLASLAACIVYGILNWNRDGKTVSGPTPQEEAWSREEEKIEEEITGEGKV